MQIYTHTAEAVDTSTEDEAGERPVLSTCPFGTPRAPAPSAQPPRQTMTLVPANTAEARKAKREELLAALRELGEDPELVLAAAGGGGQALPDGSYHRTCRCCAIQTGQLLCECQTRVGAWAKTSIDPKACTSGKVVNCDGKLTCDQCPGPAPSPDMSAAPAPSPDASAASAPSPPPSAPGARPGCGIRAPVPRRPRPAAASTRNTASTRAPAHGDPACAPAIASATAPASAWRPDAARAPPDTPPVPHRDRARCPRPLPGRRRHRHRRWTPDRAGGRRVFGQHRPGRGRASVDHQPSRAGRRRRRRER